MITNLEILRAFFASHEDVVFAYLFGSQVHGQAHALSDIDVAVMLAESLNADQRFAMRLDLMGEVSHLTQTNAVDVLILNDAPLALAYRVLHDGQLLACHDRDRLIAYTAHGQCLS
jgi:hypothetical protein